MTFGDAMRNKARLSVTGSTGENGRVMTPEFPKAVHAVPYVRPDMGLNVSLTDLSWSMRNFWVPYSGFNIPFFLSFPPSFCSGTFSVSIWWKGKVGDGGFILSPTKNCIVTFCLYFSPYKSPPSLGGITSRITKQRLFFLNWWHHAFYLPGLDWDGKEGLIDGNGCFWESEL